MENYRQPINLIGGGFQHTFSSSGFEPKYISWVKNGTTSPISMYVDFALKIPVNKETKNYGWLAESKTINPQLYSWCSENIHLLKEKFICVFTHDIELVELSKIFVLTQCSSKSFIPEKDHKIYDKTKLVSMVASNKVYYDEHRYRQQMVNKFRNNCDLFGRGYNEIENKLDGLKEYCFSITMENATYPNMVSEKITDCFVTGTVPIFHGIKNIGDFFNKNGIIVLDENFKIENLSFELYNKMKPYIIENYEIATKLLSAEDFIYINFIKKEIDELTNCN